MSRKSLFGRLTTALSDGLLTQLLTTPIGGFLGLATSTLRELLADDIPPQIRLGSAKTVFDVSLKLREVMLFAEPSKMLRRSRHCG